MDIEPLRAVIEAFPERPFSVIGGGLFENLPAVLRRGGLFARSLFLEQADPEVQKAGPWLIALDQSPTACDFVLNLVGERPTAVFWSCGMGEMTLWRHLRSLNIARIPSWAARGGVEPPSRASHYDYVNVLFRHWDARVLSALLPCLEAAQFSRFFGPADEATFACVDYGVKKIIRDPSWPTAEPGPLTVNSEQIEAGLAEQVKVSQMRIGRYLREVASEETSNIDEKDLKMLIARSFESGRRMGLFSEQAYGRWAYILTKNNWRENSELQQAITNGGANPDRNVMNLVEKIDKGALK